MIEFITGALTIGIVWFFASYKGGLDSKLVDYDHKLYSRDWNGLKGWMEAKAWNLHIEEQGWKKDKEKEIKALNKKLNKWRPTKKDRELWQDCIKWEQQKGKIIFITGTLEGFFGDATIKDKIFKERRWKLSEDGNRIEQI